MSEWIDHAVVLRVGHFREADLWLKLLCRRHGMLTLFAFGGSRSKRRFPGCLDVLNSLRCRVRTSGRAASFMNLEEAVLEEGPQGLRSDWRRMGLATNCLRFVEALGVTEEGADKAFALVEDLRRTLDTAQELPGMLPLFFRLRFAGAAGFAPCLSHCGLCGKPVTGAAQFVVDEGQIRCPACRKDAPPAHYGVDLSSAVLQILCTVQQTQPSTWQFSPLLPPERRSMSRAIDGFVQYHLGLAWEDGYFRRV
ncbi:MAG: DNA repair protein RecO C-terminal domain-containing protein [Desulfovibrio sp.]|nr:DNA repair protein RecO C-terminal domain-containing protein [Desulfovibrio sp.]